VEEANPNSDTECEDAEIAINKVQYCTASIGQLYLSSSIALICEKWMGSIER
jgi:hypothetical protein